MNWHRPENDLALAAKALNETELLQVYNHKMRDGDGGGILCNCGCNTNGGQNEAKKKRGEENRREEWTCQSRIRKFVVES